MVALPASRKPRREGERRGPSFLPPKRANLAEEADRFSPGGGRPDLENDVGFADEDGDSSPRVVHTVLSYCSNNGGIGGSQAMAGDSLAMDDSLALDEVESLLAGCQEDREKGEALDSDSESISVILHGHMSDQSTSDRQRNKPCSSVREEVDSEHSLVAKVMAGASKHSLLQSSAFNFFEEQDEDEEEEEEEEESLGVPRRQFKVPTSHRRYDFSAIVRRFPKPKPPAASSKRPRQKRSKVTVGHSALQRQLGRAQQQQQLGQQPWGAGGGEEVVDVFRFPATQEEEEEEEEEEAGERRCGREDAMGARRKNSKADVSYSSRTREEQVGFIV